MANKTARKADKVQDEACGRCGALMTEHDAYGRRDGCKGYIYSTDGR